MEFYKILLICCAIYYVDAGGYCTGELLKLNMEKCLNEVGATPDDIEDLLSQKKAANEKAKCFRGCLLQECEVIDANGYLDHSVPMRYYEILSRGDPSKLQIMDEVIKKCLNSNQSGGKVCETAEEYLDCVFTNCGDCGWEFHGI